MATDLARMSREDLRKHQDTLLRRYKKLEKEVTTKDPGAGKPPAEAKAARDRAFAELDLVIEEMQEVKGRMQGAQLRVPDPEVFDSEKSRFERWKAAALGREFRQE